MTSRANLAIPTNYQGASTLSITSIVSPDFPDFLPVPRFPDFLRFPFPSISFPDFLRAAVFATPPHKTKSQQIRLFQKLSFKV
jgi:hypothetical protein